MIKSWSLSRLQVFEPCRHRAYLQYDLKIPQPVRALPDGKLEHANDRGSRLHDNAELFIRGKAKLAPELRKHFTPEFEALYRLFREKKVFLEGEWGMDRNWNPCEWKEAWLRLKLDALVFLSPQHAVVIDYKTGRREGNEIKHAEQVQLYQLVTFLRYPKLDTIDVELWYPDIDFLFNQTYHRDQGLRFMRKFNERGNTITTYEFKGEREDANPSIYTCRYCPYGIATSSKPERTGHCKRGV